MRIVLLSDHFDMMTKHGYEGTVSSIQRTSGREDRVEGRNAPASSGNVGLAREAVGSLYSRLLPVE